MNDYWWDDAKFAAVIALGTLLLLAAMVVLFIAVDRASCLAAWSAFRPQWTVMSGCRVSVDGRMTPVEAVRKVALEVR